MGDGGTTNGINENNTVIDMHGLLSIHMPAYSDSIIKGVSTIMVSYSSWNGEKMHANRELVTGFLKGTLKFKVTFHFSFFILHRYNTSTSDLRLNLCVNVFLDISKIMDTSSLSLSLFSPLHRRILTLTKIMEVASNTVLQRHVFYT